MDSTLDVASRGESDAYICPVPAYCYAYYIEHTLVCDVTCDSWEAETREVDGSGVGGTCLVRNWRPEKAEARAVFEVREQKSAGMNY